MADQGKIQQVPITLAALLELDLPSLEIYGDSAVQISGIELDSRVIDSGDLFVAIEGHQMHGVQFLNEAVMRGATAVLTDPVGWEQLAGLPITLPVLVLPQARRHLGVIANTVYGRASERINVMGVTGTNGKTTTATMIEAALAADGRSTGFIGTTGIRIGSTHIDNKRTTPEATTLHGVFAYMEERSVSDVVMEVSSHAVIEHRISGLHFSVVGFTNLSQDHLDYHHTMEEYFLAKASLFTSLFAKQAVICIDDEWGERLASSVTIPVTTISVTGKPADWTAHLTADGLVQIAGPNGVAVSTALLLPGEFNRANALLAFVMLYSVDVAPEVISEAFSTVQVPGRLEQVSASNGAAQIRGIVDYAHTPDAIERVVAAVREATSGQLIVVVGAGGDRDVTKRPLMGQSAARLADRVIVTDDNPRSEDPVFIRASVLKGARAVSSMSGSALLEIGDRAEAIREAVSQARAGDVVLVLGKGHEQGQEINGIVTAFDDREILNRLLEVRNGDVA